MNSGLTEAQVIQELFIVIEKYRQSHIITCGKYPYNWRSNKDRCDVCKLADMYLGTTL